MTIGWMDFWAVTQIFFISKNGNWIFSLRSHFHKVGKMYRCTQKRGITCKENVGNGKKLDEKSTFSSIFPSPKMKNRPDFWLRAKTIIGAPTFLFWGKNVN